MHSLESKTSTEKDRRLTRHPYSLQDLRDEYYSETEFGIKDKEENKDLFWWFVKTKVTAKRKMSSNSRIVVWNDLNAEQSQKLLDAPILNDVRDILAEIFDLTNYTEDLQVEVLLHLYTYTVQYARDKEFSSKQLSAYFSIVKNVHEFCVQNAFVTFEETFDIFEELLICHCILRPPHSLELFSIEEAKKIAYHLVDTYFRHFKLYKYAFTPEVLLDLTLSYAGESESAATQDENESETESSEEEILSPERQMELLKNSEKEKAKAYLRKVITEFLQQKIQEIKLSVQEKLKDAEKRVNGKLDEAGYSKYIKKIRSRSRK